jgi:hypothetical protein
VHPEFAESLRAARAANNICAEVFTGKVVRGRVEQINKQAWAAKFKKYAVLAGVNAPKKSCHGLRNARAEVADYADCTESQMMAMFGWTDPKMPAHYIAQANRERLGVSGMDKIVAFDQSQSLDDFMPLPEVNNKRTPRGNGVVTFPGNIRKKLKNFNTKRGCMVRSEGLEPPRFYSLPPQGSASTSSATSAWEAGFRLVARRINGADVSNRSGGYKPAEASNSTSLQAKFRPVTALSPGPWQARQHLLDFDRNPVAIDQHHAAGDGEIIGQNLDLVGLGRVQLDDGAAGET